MPYKPAHDPDHARAAQEQAALYTAVSAAAAVPGLKTCFTLIKIVKTLGAHVAETIQAASGASLQRAIVLRALQRLQATGVTGAAK